MNNFEKSGYGTLNIGIGERCALLIVDFQRGFTDPNSQMGQSKHIQNAVNKTVELVDFAHQNNLPIASCRVSWAGPAEMAYWKVPYLFEGGFFHGQEFTEIDPRLADPINIYEFVKTAPSIFFKTPIATWLTKKNIDTTIIAGCTTSGCIRASVIDSFSYGYRTIIAEDCCGDQDLDAHNNNINDMRRRYADILTVDELKVALCRAPKSSEY
ncbi:MAG: maleamate amidohydrolase [Gammaproteobacteria bacterium]|jgi:maleamate amidohydrolase